MTADFSRQSYLGPNAQDVFASAVIGVIGVGGGGSHIVQQLAHLGFLNYVIIDPEEVEGSNLSRLVGMTEADIQTKTLKITIAERVIMGIRPSAEVRSYASKWQKALATLKECDLIFGCLDSFTQRRELEIFSRRYLIPYIDIGMDVHVADERSVPRVAGQVVLSIPGSSCMRCMDFPSERSLKKELDKYGDAGINPQVVFANGVLASTAVSLAVDLFTGWGRSNMTSAYLSFDGNSLSINEHIKHICREKSCSHFTLDQIGEPKFVRA